MKILIHTDEYYPTAQACAYRMRVMTDAFIDKGNNVTVIASSTNIGAGKKEERREKIFYAPTIKMKKKNTLWRMLNNISFAITSIFTAFKVGKIDVVLTTSPPPLISISGWIIAKLKGAKLIYDVRDIWPDVAIEMGSFSDNSSYAKIFGLISRFMYKHSDYVTTVSPGKVEKIKRYVELLYGNKKHIDKVKLVGNGYDESVENAEIDEGLISKYDLKNKFTCVYIGNIGLAQGLDLLFEVAQKSKYKDVQFLLFGKGAEKERLEKEAIAKGLDNVKFCGILPHEKVFTILSYAKLSFIPLKNSNMKDSIPTKVYEALGIGCPVLLVAEGDSCDIVNEAKMGKCISPDHPEILPKAFDEIFENYNEFKNNKMEAKKLMKDKYSRQKIALEFEKQLHTLVK